MSSPLKFAFLAVILLAYLAMVALFIHLLVPAIRSRSPRELLRRASLLGLPLAVGLALAAGAWIFASGLVTTAPRLSFDHEQMGFAAVIVPIFAPFVALFQLVVLAVAQRLGLSERLQAVVSTTPILLAALALVGLTLSLAQPEDRFEELLGTRPPASATDIVYERETRFAYTRVKLTCRMDPEDATEVLRVRPDDVTVTYDRSTRLLTAEYLVD